MGSTAEHEAFKDRIRANLESAGILVSNNPIGAACHGGRRWVTYGLRFFKKKGAADLIAIVNGRFCAIECKTGGAKMDKDQLFFAVTLMMAGGIYICVWDNGRIEGWFGEHDNAQKDQ